MLSAKRIFLGVVIGFAALMLLCIGTAHAETLSIGTNSIITAPVFQVLDESVYGSAGNAFNVCFTIQLVVGLFAVLLKLTIIVFRWGFNR